MQSRELVLPNGYALDEYVVDQSAWGRNPSEGITTESALKLEQRINSLNGMYHGENLFRQDGRTMPYSIDGMLGIDAKSFNILVPSIQKYKLPDYLKEFALTFFDPAQRRDITNGKKVGVTDLIFAGDRLIMFIQPVGYHDFMWTNNNLDKLFPRGYTIPEKGNVEGLMIRQIELRQGKAAPYRNSVFANMLESAFALTYQDRTVLVRRRPELAVAGGSLGFPGGTFDDYDNWGMFADEKGIVDLGLYLRTHITSKMGEEFGLTTGEFKFANAWLTRCFERHTPLVVAQVELGIEPERLAERMIHKPSTTKQHYSIATAPIADVNGMSGYLNHGSEFSLRAVNAKKL